MAIKIKRGDFMKMSVSFTRNTHFHVFGTCFWRSKSTKKRIRKRTGFWRAFLMDFASFWKSFWTPKSIKNRCRNLIDFWMRLVRALWSHTHQICRESVGGKWKGYPWGRGGKGVEWYYYTEFCLSWFIGFVLRRSKRLALKGWRICTAERETGALLGGKRRGRRVCRALNKTISLFPLNSFSYKGSYSAS